MAQKMHTDQCVPGAPWEWDERADDEVNQAFRGPP